MRFRIRGRAERVRIPVAAVLAAHGAIHLMGFVLLFTIARPSGLAYAGMSFTRRNAQSTISTQPPPDPRPATR
jgi:hypothetical protein